MVQSNPHFQKLRREYIFPIIEKKLQEVKALHPDADILNAGIGDVSMPLAPCIADAIAKATLEMSSPQSIRGYGPSEGYLFLRETIAEHE
ncbi:MAG: LL-diaminopimelate aminotransferase, partial [Chlamydiia bacterium]|nr:LL-diaminopimelate aminotransferase [Chlamydiia bacterium]